MIQTRTNPNPGKANDPKGSRGFAPNLFSLIKSGSYDMIWRGYAVKNTQTRKYDLEEKKLPCNITFES